MAKSKNKKKRDAKKRTAELKKATKKKTTTKKKTSSTKPKVTTTTKKKTSSTKPKVATKKNTKSKVVKKTSQKTNVKKKTNSITKKENLKSKISNIFSKIKINKKIIYSIFGLFALICLIIIITNTINKNKTIEDFIIISKDKYYDLLDSENYEYIYLYENNCARCELSEPNLIKLQNDLNIKIYKINKSKLDVTYDAPSLLVVSNSKVVAVENANKEYSALKKFISNSKNVNTYSFENIGISKYLSLVKSKETTIIYLGNDTCNEFSYILDEVAKEKNIKVNYLNLDSIKSEDDWGKLNNSLDILNKTWFTPAILIIKDEKLKSYKMETMEKYSLIEYLEKNGL